MLKDLLKVETPAQNNQNAVRGHICLWFAQKVEQSLREPFFEILEITPAMAAVILENNDNNRPIYRNVVRKFTSDIKNGLFQMNGETIIVANDGSLNDGQHRLLAVIAANRNIRTAIMFGATRESRMTVDMGQSRVTADVLHMNGVKNTTATGATSRLLLMYDQGIFHDSGATSEKIVEILTKQRIVDFYKAHGPRIDYSVAETCNVPFFKKGGVSAWAAAHFLINSKDMIAADIFFKRAGSGESLERGNPILTLRQHILETASTGLRPTHRLEIILRYWNAWRENKTTIRRLAMIGSHPRVK